MSPGHSFHLKSLTLVKAIIAIHRQGSWGPELRKLPRVTQPVSGRAWAEPRAPNFSHKLLSGAKGKLV